MKEMPRETREKLIMQWYEKKLNRDEILKIFEQKDLFDEKLGKKIKSEIIKNFYENFEKAKEDEGFKSADAKYREIKKAKKQINGKTKEIISKKKSTEKELQEIDKQMTKITEIAMDLEDGSWWKMGKLKRTNAKRDELDTQMKKIQGEINKLEMEKQSIKISLKKMEREYGPKIKREIKRPTLNLEKGIKKLNIKQKNETTLQGYKETYFQTIESISKYMDNLIQGAENLDIGISEDKKNEVINLIKKAITEKIETMKNGNKITKMADEIEKWLENNLEVSIKKLGDLRKKIDHKESEINELESKEKGTDTEELLKIREQEYESKRELIELKNEYNTIKEELSEKLKKYYGLDIEGYSAQYIKKRKR